MLKIFGRTNEILYGLEARVTTVQKNIKTNE